MKTDRTAASVDRIDLDTMSTEALDRLHDRVRDALSERLRRQITLLDGRLAGLGKPTASRMLSVASAPVRQSRGKRYYPPVKPKYRDPSDHSRTWSGRGKRPRWMTAKMTANRRLTVDSFLIR